MFDKASRALNPDDPTSPLARHSAQLERQHTDLTSHLTTLHKELAQQVSDLRAAVQAQQAAQTARARLASVTPIKGGTYEQRVHTLLGEIAVGLGDEYVETSHRTGTISRCKKGDGVLTEAGASARVVVEATTDEQRTGWADYLDVAERNRQAEASLGLVPTADLNAGHSVRALGPRRVILAFDPEVDDPSLLRTVLQLLRVAALAAAATRQDDKRASEATERIAEALATLPKIERIRQCAGSIRKNADTIDIEGERVHSGLSRLLLQAQTALAAVSTDHSVAVFSCAADLTARPDGPSPDAA